MEGFSKTVEAGEHVDVRDLFDGVQDVLQQAILDMGGTG